MPELAVDFEEIGMAMETHDSEMQFYLDLESGEVMMIPWEVQRLESFEEADLAKLEDWEREPAGVMAALDEGSERYERIPQIPSYEGYNVMVEFAETVVDQRLAGKLEVALDGKGAFGRFKRVL